MEASQSGIITLVRADEPQHGKLRRLTNDWFKPASVRRLDDRLDELSDEALQKLRDVRRRVRLRGRDRPVVPAAGDPQDPRPPRSRLPADAQADPGAVRPTRPRPAARGLRRRPRDPRPGRSRDDGLLHAAHGGAAGQPDRRPRHRHRQRPRSTTSRWATRDARLLHHRRHRRPRHHLVGDGRRSAGAHRQPRPAPQAAGPTPTCSTTRSKR